jgi:hypothetical protein
VLHRGTLSRKERGGRGRRRVKGGGIRREEVLEQTS